MCAPIFVFTKRTAKRKLRVEKIDLELIMSDIAIGYLGGALIFFANLKYSRLLCKGGYFLVKYKSIDQ